MRHFLLMILLLISFVACKKEETTCPIHYHGPDCSSQITPSNIIVNTITITKVPPTDNGAGWDLTSGPDIFVVITDSKGNVVINTRSAFAQNSFTATFQINWIVSNAIDSFTFSVYDYDDDLSADDYLGGIEGAIYSSTNGFPSTITMACSNCNVAFSMPALYTW